VITLGEIVLIHDLKRQGLSVSAIARKLGMDRKTVRKHLEVGLAAPAYNPRPAQPRLIAPYEDYLRARVTAWPDLSGKRLRLQCSLTAHRRSRLPLFPRRCYPKRADSTYDWP
jgi:hypothetical protein